MSDSIAFEIQLDEAYPEAIERVTTALKAEGFGILTRIDVDTTLKEKIGVDFRRYVILGACNPPLAHKALSADAVVGLMLPCNVTVEEQTGAAGSIARIGNPKVMLGVGTFDRNPTLREVADDVYARLERAAASLARAAV